MRTMKKLRKGFSIFTLSLYIAMMFLQSNVLALEPKAQDASLEIPVESLNSGDFYQSFEVKYNKELVQLGETFVVEIPLEGNSSTRATITYKNIETGS